MGKMAEAELIQTCNFRYWQFEMIYHECLKIRVDNLAYITTNFESIRRNRDCQPAWCFPTGHVNQENIRCTRCYFHNSQHFKQNIFFSTILGVPALMREYSECYKNSRNRRTVTGIASTNFRRQKFQYNSLGVPVRLSNFSEPLRNSLTNKCV